MVAMDCSTKTSR